MKVDVYEYDRCRTGDHTTVSISSAIMHPQYSNSNLKNDLCILKLSSAAHGPYASLPTSRIDPPYGENAPTSHAIVAGWGTTRYQGSVPCALKKSELDTVRCKNPSYKLVQNGYGVYLDDSKHICTYDIAGSGASDACQGTCLATST